MRTQNFKIFSFVIGCGFLLFAVFFFLSGWIGIEFIYDNGLSNLTYDDLRNGKAVDLLLIDLPLFLSGVFFGNSFRTKSRQTEAT